MVRKVLLSFLILKSATVLANEDLVLPGERWLGKSTGYICAADTSKKVSAPKTLDSIKVSFQTLTTDYSLDNALLKASFLEDGNTCKYSALLFANNAARTINLVESKAYSVEKSSLCEQGKALLDEALADNSYLYWGHPHHVTIMIPDSQAEKLCGADSDKVGVDFLAVGRI